MSFKLKSIFEYLLNSMTKCNIAYLSSVALVNAIVTSEVDLDDQEIINRYSDLWKIEDSFRIYKSDLKTRLSIRI